MFETAAYCADEFVIEPSMLLTSSLSVLLHSPCSSYGPIHGSLANDSKPKLYLNLGLGDCPTQKPSTEAVERVDSTKYRLKFSETHYTRGIERL